SGRPGAAVRKLVRTGLRSARRCAWRRDGASRERERPEASRERERPEADTVAKWRSRKKSRHKFLGNQGLVTHNPLRQLTPPTWRTRSGRGRFALFRRTIPATQLPERIER